MDDGDLQLEHFFELSLDLLTVAGFDGYFKRLSPMWSRTLGWTMEEFLSTPSLEFVHPEDREATLAARNRIKDGVPLTGLLNRYRCKDGSYRWLEWKSVAYPDRQLVYAVARDVTAQREAEQERQRVQEQLRAAERLALVGRLAAGVAHEINNPLAFILANLRAALRELPGFRAPNPEQMSEMEEMLADSLQGAERVQTIVRGLSTFARPGAQPHAPLELHPILKEAIRLTSDELGIQAQLVEDYGPTPPVEADAASLIEVFRNLLSNAAQAFAGLPPAPHEIRLSTSTAASGRAVVEVQDNGAGMSAETKGRLFEPFVSTRAVGKGTGLGLAISHNLITELGGTITVESQEGRGTTVRVELPAAGSAGFTGSGSTAPPDP